MVGWSPQGLVVGYSSELVMELVVLRRAFCGTYLLWKRVGVVVAGYLMRIHPGNSASIDGNGDVRVLICSPLVLGKWGIRVGSIRGFEMGVEKFEVSLNGGQNGVRIGIGRCSKWIGMLFRLRRCYA